MDKYTDTQIDAALNQELNDVLSDVIGAPIHDAIVRAVCRKLRGVSEERVWRRLREMLYGGEYDSGW